MAVDGQLVSRTEHPTEARRGPAAVLATVERAIEEVAARVGGVSGIGVACAGQIHPETGAVVYAPNLDWRDVPLRARLTEAFSVSVTVENDVRAAAWGEFRFGAGHGAGSLIAVFVGTGVGSGAVLDGRLWRGAGNAAGEVGHTQVVSEGRPCPCGGRGCLEQYASGSGFQRRFRDALARGVVTRLADETGGESARLTATMVAAAAEAGDGFAQEVWSDALRYLSVGVANYVTLLNPSVLVLGGGVVEAVPALLDAVAREVSRLTSLMARRTLRIERARLGDWSGVVGAAALAPLA